MKKWLSLLLSLSLTVTGFASCSEEEKPKAAGGFTLNTETVPGPIPERAKAAFDYAVADMEAAEYDVIAYLGSQVVSGMNYSFLCYGTNFSSPKPPCQYDIVKVYAGFDGTAKVTEIKHLDLLNYTSRETASEPKLLEKNLPGGWTLNPDFGTVLPEAAQTALENAVSGMTGVGYRPVACLGTQVVAGTNYAILAAMTSVTAEPREGLVVLTVYAGLDGTAQILSVAAV